MLCSQRIGKCFLRLRLHRKINWNAIRWSHHVVFWKENGKQQQCEWRSRVCKTLPRNVIAIHQPIDAGDALNTLKDNIALLWKGDYEEGKRFFTNISHHFEETQTIDMPKNMALLDKFYTSRAIQQERVEVLSKFILCMRRDEGPMKQKAKIRKACEWALGQSSHPYLLPLREVLGIIGAYQWKVTGIPIPQLQATIYPDYTVYAPSTRSEYLELLLHISLPKRVKTAFDIGTGTGILTAILKRRGISRIIATDINPRAVICARDNLERLRLSDGVDVVHANVFPPDIDGKPQLADLIVCNPPWIPYVAHTALDMGSYDTDSRMLHTLLAGLKRHLRPNGVAYLILSDFAELIGLRSRENLLRWISQYQLKVVNRIETVPTNPKVFDKLDPLYEARSREVTSLWVLHVSKVALSSDEYQPVIE